MNLEVDSPPEPPSKCELKPWFWPCEALRRGTSQVDLDFWSKKVWVNKFVWLSATKFVAICYNNNRKLIQEGSCYTQSHIYLKLSSISYTSAAQPGPGSWRHLFTEPTCLKGTMLDADRNTSAERQCTCTRGKTSGETNAHMTYSNPSEWWKLLMESHTKLCETWVRWLSEEEGKLSQGC